MMGASGPELGRSRPNGSLTEPEPPRETRKTVPVLFADMSGRLEQAVALLQFTDLGLFGQRQTVSNAVFDPCASDPAVQARLRDTEVPGDLGQRGLLAQGHGDKVTAELLRETLWAW